MKLYTSVVVVPVFYGTYTALGLVNTIIYLDEIGNYPGWAIALVFIGIGVLIYGVYLLSSKPDPSNHRHASEQDNDEDDDGDNTDGNNDVERRRREDRLGGNTQQQELQIFYYQHSNRSWPSARDEKQKALMTTSSSPSLLTTGIAPFSVIAEPSNSQCTFQRQPLPREKHWITRCWDKWKSHSNNIMRKWHPGELPSRTSDTNVHNPRIN